MDDLVERLDAEIKRQRETHGTYLHLGSPNPLLVEARSRITELETALAEAEGRVIAEVVAWLRHQHVEIRAMRSPVRNLDDIATALETGEWKK